MKDRQYLVPVFKSDNLRAWEWYVQVHYPIDRSEYLDLPEYPQPIIGTTCFHKGPFPTRCVRPSNHGGRHLRAEFIGTRRLVTAVWESYED